MAFGPGIKKLRMKLTFIITLFALFLAVLINGEDNITSQEKQIEASDAVQQVDDADYHRRRHHHHSSSSDDDYGYNYYNDDDYGRGYYGRGRGRRYYGRRHHRHGRWH